MIIYVLNKEYNYDRIVETIGAFRKLEDVFASINNDWDGEKGMYNSIIIDKNKNVSSNKSNSQSDIVYKIIEFDAKDK